MGGEQLWRFSLSLSSCPNKHFFTVCSLVGNVLALELEKP